MYNESNGSYINKKNVPIIKDEKNGFLRDINNNIYLDLFSGCCSNPWGSNYKPILNTINNQSQKLMSYYDFPHEERIKLSENVLKYTSKDYKIMYSVTGSQAIGNAIRLALFNIKSKIYITKNSFHGNIVGKNLTNRHENDIYYPQAEIVSVDNINEVPSNSIFILEPYESANNGGFIRSNEELNLIVKYCKNNNILCIWDEIQTGMFRTGDLFVCNKIKHRPDILIVGKSLANGLPLSLVLFNNKLKDWDIGSYSSTFAANPLACAIGNTIFEELFINNYQDIIKENSNILKSYMLNNFTNFKSEGYYISIDCNSKEDIFKKCLDNGLFIRFTKGKIFLTPKFTTEIGYLIEGLNKIKRIIY